MSTPNTLLTSTELTDLLTNINMLADDNGLLYYDKDFSNADIIVVRRNNLNNSEFVSYFSADALYNETSQELYLQDNNNCYNKFTLLEKYTTYASSRFEIVLQPIGGAIILPNNPRHALIIKVLKSGTEMQLVFQWFKRVGGTDTLVSYHSIAGSFYGVIEDMYSTPEPGEYYCKITLQPIDNPNNPEMLESDLVTVTKP